MSIHKCGACNSEYQEEQQYLDHECESTGFKPTEIEHQDELTGGMASKVAESAIQRGEEKKTEEGQ